jgi:hypothetical protein
MKKWFWRVAGLVVLVAALWWGVTLLFPPTEVVVRRRLQELAVVASYASNEAPLAQVANAQNLAAFFTPEVQISLEVPGNAVQTATERDDVFKAAMGARTMMNSLRIDFYDIVVMVENGNLGAVANLTAKIKVPTDRDYYVQELRFHLRKVDGKWLIDRVETVKTLSQASTKPAWIHTAKHWPI